MLKSKMPGLLALGVTLLLFALLTASASAVGEPITISPTSGPPGTTVTVKGSGWQGYSDVPIQIDGKTLAMAHPDANGNFSVKITIPKDATPGSRLRIDALYGNGGSANAWFDVTESGSGAPAAPSKLSVTAVDSNSIRLQWVDNSDNEGGFQIHNGVTSRTVGPNETTYDWGGLEPGTYMCFRVRAYNKAGSSAWEPNSSPWYKCTTTPSTPPSTKQPPLSLPWSSTEGATTWYYSGGPHCDLRADPGNKCPSDAVRYAVDFMPPGQPGCSVKREESGWVTAAQTGIVRARGNSLVEIDHGRGFRTGYYHLRSNTIPPEVQLGKEVGAGNKLGRPSCEAGLGGKAFGVHVHFYICEQTNPDKVCGPYATSSAARPIDGLVIGGWTIHAAVDQNYDGTMTKGKELRTAIAVQCGPGNANPNCGNDLNHLKR